jgi:hypothetical protein
LSKTQTNAKLQIGTSGRAAKMPPPYGKLPLPPWSKRAIVLPQDLAMIGHVRFRSSPDPDYLRRYASGALKSATASSPITGGTVMRPKLSQP